MNDLFSAQPDPNMLYAVAYPMRPHADSQGNLIEVPDGELLYAPGYFNPATSDAILRELLANDRYPAGKTDWNREELDGGHWSNIDWHQDFVTLYGKRSPLPRLSAWHGDSDHSYTYSGITLAPQPWCAVLERLRRELHALTGLRFNSVLLNWYRDGDDHISWHTDAEPELGTNPTIASINFGATRRFVLRRNDDHGQKVELPLGHGSVLVMRGALQHHWQHAVPRQKRVHDARINLTFRIIRSRD